MEHPSGPERKAVLRQRLKDFLIKRRQETSPEALGLPRVARRKTPGLRREEVAQLAGIGVTWYTWLEQGRVFMDPARQAVYRDWDSLAHLVAGQFRLMYGKLAGELYVEKMLADMLKGSERFRQIWTEQLAINTASAQVFLNAPGAGLLNLVTVRFRPLATPDWLLCVLIPQDQGTRARLKRLKRQHCST